MGLDDVNDCYDHEDSDTFDARKFHGDAAEPDIDYNYDNDEEFSGMKFHGVNKNCERICDNCHDTDKY